MIKICLVDDGRHRGSQVIVIDTFKKTHKKKTFLLLIKFNFIKFLNN